MVRIPEYTSDVSLRPAYQQENTSRASPEDFGAAIGRGMEGIAQGVGRFAQVMAQAKQLENETIARDARNSYMADADELMYGEGGYTLTQQKQAIDDFPKLEERLGEIRRKYASGLTPEQASIFKQSVDVDELNRKRTALIHRGSEGKKYTISTHEAGANGFLEEAFNTRKDAKQSAVYLGAAHAEIDELGRLQGLPQEAVDQKKAEITDGYHSRVAGDLVLSDPVAAVDYVQKNIGSMSPEAANRLLTQLAKPLGEAAGRDAANYRPSALPADVGDRSKQAMAFYMRAGLTKEQAGGIVGNLIAESNLRPSGAVGDKGTAFGIAQWRGERLNRLKRFAASQGKSWEDFEVQLGFVLVELKNHETDAYASLMSASTVDEATAAMISYERPAGWTKGNPRGGHNWQGRLKHAMGAAGMDVKAGDVVAGEDGGVVFSPETEQVIAGLPAFMQSQVRDIAAAGVADITAKQAAMFKAEQAAIVDDFRLRIETGDTGLTQQEILASTALDDGDKAGLISRFNEKFDGIIAAQQNVAAFNAGAFRVDPYSEDGRKAVDGVWQSFADNAKASGDPNQAINILPNLVEQTGVVPKVVFNAIRGGVNSMDAGKVVDSLGLALRLSDADPTALRKREGGAEISDALASFRHMVGDLGMTPEQAAASLIEMRDPEKRKARAAVLESQPVKDWLKAEATPTSIATIFDAERGWFSGAPNIGETPVQSAAMVADYREILEQSMFDVGGDFAQAKALAADRFRRTYGVTGFSITGDATVTRLPVERTYGAGGNGTHEYIREQAKADLKKEGIAATEVYFIADGATERDVAAGKPPRYRVFYEDDDGVLEEFNGHLTFMAPSPADVAAERRRASNLKSLENRRRLENSRDRDFVADQFLNGYKAGSPDEDTVLRLPGGMERRKPTGFMDMITNMFGGSE